MERVQIYDALAERVNNKYIFICTNYIAIINKQLIYNLLNKYILVYSSYVTYTAMSLKWYINK